MSTNVVRCDIDKNGWCGVYNCGTKKVPTSVKKWGWIESKKAYGNRTVKVTRNICMNRIVGRIEPTNSPQPTRLAGVNNVSVGGLIRRLSTAIEIEKGKSGD